MPQCAGIWGEMVWAELRFVAESKASMGPRAGQARVLRGRAELEATRSIEIFVGEAHSQLGKGNSWPRKWGGYPRKWPHNQPLRILQPGALECRRPPPQGRRAGSAHDGCPEVRRWAGCGQKQVVVPRWNAGIATTLAVPAPRWCNTRPPHVPVPAAHVAADAALASTSEGISGGPQP